jgi:hypothetical protein
MPIYQLGQDHIAIEKLFVLRTGLGKKKHSENTTQCKQGTNETMINKTRLTK